MKNKRCDCVKVTHRSLFDKDSLRRESQGSHTKCLCGHHPEARHKVSNWRVWEYDVWGNAEDGWEINDRSELTDYLFSGRLLELKDESDYTLLEALKKRGWLKSRTRIEDLKIDGDEISILINQAEDDYPLLGLSRVDDIC